MYHARMDTNDGMSTDLAALLDGKAIDECMRIDAMLKQSVFETTQRVFFQGANGSEIGPFVRKVFPGNKGARELGGAYQALFDAQRSGARFAHLPRIMQVLDVGDMLIVVMEHVSGDTLRDRIERRPNERARIAAAVAPLLCDAAIELHEGLRKTIVHRDITPSNVLCCGEDPVPSSLVLIDLGIAREHKPDASGDTSRFGTEAYASPEQFGFGQTDVRSDIYSMGMTLAFCLLGHDPSAQEREIGFRLPGVDPALALVLAKATSLDPAHRYSCVHDFKSAIMAALAPASADSVRKGDQPVVRGDSLHRPGDGRPVPPIPDGSHSHRHSVESGSRPRSRLSRIPRKVGAVWDAFVCLLWLALLAFATYRTIVPFDTMEACPAGIRAFVYFGIFVIPAAFLLFLVLDKRPLYERSRFWASISSRRIHVVCLCAGLGSFIIFTAIGLAMATPYF